jgi:hypothetical protein
MYAGESRRHAEASGPSTDDATRIAGKLVVSLGNPCRGVGDRCDPRKVDTNGSVPHRLHGGDMCVDETRLPKAARCGEADRHSVCCCTLEGVELAASIDQPSWSDGTLIIERIHRT